MLSEEEKKAIKLLEDIKNNSWTTKYIMSSDSKNADILLNLITKLQKENEEKDKIIYEIARSNVKLKGYEIEEKYIDTTIRFFTKYVKNLERNPQWRNDKNE